MNHEDPSELTGLVDTIAPPDQTWGELFVEGDADKIRTHLQDELIGLFQKWSRHLKNYNVILFYVENGISYDDSDEMYRALSAVPSQKKDVLMVLVSTGGLLYPRTRSASSVGSGRKTGLLSVCRGTHTLPLR